MSSLIEQAAQRLEQLRQAGAAMPESRQPEPVDAVERPTPKTSASTPAVPSPAALADKPVAASVDGHGSEKFAMQASLRSTCGFSMKRAEVTFALSENLTIHRPFHNFMPTQTFAHL